MSVNRRWNGRIACSSLLGVLASGAVRLCAQQPAPTGAPTASTAPAPIYDTAADGKAQIAAGLARAKSENKRVLLMFGGNWCGWCHKLHALFKENQEIAKVLQYEYELVLVDIGRRDKHMDVASGYGVDLKKGGVPFLTVLDAEGKVLVNQPTDALEEGDHHDPQKVLAFLNRWKAEPRDAGDVVLEAFARARTEQKRVFLHLGAPWCGWCRRLAEFLARPEIAAIMQQDFVLVKIDVDRMKGGQEFARRIRPSEKGGIPWFVISDADSKTLATSDGPNGNIGFPVKPDEISHFIGMLKQTARRTSADQIARIEQALKESAAKLEQQSRGGG